MQNLILLVGLFTLFSFSSTGQNRKIVDKVQKNIDWPSFMQKHDLVWEEMPLQWNEGAFVGNGHIGMMMYVSQKENAITFHIGRQDVTDHRKAPNKKSSVSVIGANGFTDFTRFEIGKMYLKPSGKILSGTIRQDIWNAEIRAHFTTDLGTIDVVASCPYTSNVNVVEVNSTEKTSKPGNSYQWSFKAAKAYPPRFVVKGDTSKYVRNPEPVLTEKNGFNYCVQSLNAGGDYATVWKEVNGSGSNKSTFYMTTANEIPAADKSAIKGREYIEQTIVCGLAKVKAANCEWWHNFYKKSFLSIPDAQMESFYWIQLYKMGTCFRPDAPAVDLFGPVFRISAWPYHWWNLNIQLTYWPVYPTNHLEMGENYISLVDESFDALFNRFRRKLLGDFTWAMHNYYLQFSYAGDWQSIKEKWMPKAIIIANEYQNKLIKNSEGKLEMLPLGSPEYKGFEVFPNTNYNLAMLRWLLNTLITVNEKTNAGSKDVTIWKQTLKDLIPYPVDANGLMIGSNQPVDMSHRHYSHLLALYPLFQLNPDNESDRALVEKSVVHWHKIGGGKGLAGYSFTGAASLYAALGRGNDAEAILKQFLNGNIGISLLLSNTLYVEADGKNPVIETPLSAACSITELLLQSWGGKIRVFPAVPDKWKDASFDQLRTEGAFLVSSVRRNGTTQWVQIKSLAGEPCVLKVPDWENLAVVGNKKCKIVKTAKGEFTIDLKKGEEVIISPKDKSEQPILSPVATEQKDQNAYGVKKGKQLTKDMFWTE